MKKISYFLFTACLAGIVWTSCQRESVPDASELSAQEPVLVDYDYNEQGLTSSITGSFIRNNVAILGRVLFYDKALSVNNSIACASCHHQEFAFSDGNALSRGFMGELTARNSMAIFNMPRNGGYFWDLRRQGLSSMVLDPVQHLVEMGIESPEILGKKIVEIPYYADLFYKAYGNSAFHAVNIPDLVADALSEFISSMISNTSRFDQGLGTLTGQEQRGHEVFVNAQCTNCHGGANFNNQRIFNGNAIIPRGGGGGWGGGGSGGGNNFVSLNTDFANIGLDYSYSDPGMSPEDQQKLGITEVEQGLFKIPSLRNIALTDPYMHDGRFATLMDVINHYDHEVKFHKNLDPRLQPRQFDPSTGTFVTIGNQPRRLNLSEQDKEDLIAFLNTLTDQTLITHPRFSDPFRPR